MYDEKFYENLVFKFYNKLADSLDNFSNYKKRIWKSKDGKKIFLDVIDYPDKEDTEYEKIYRKEYKSCKDLYLMNKDEINDLIYEFKGKIDKFSLSKAFDNFELTKEEATFIFKNCFPYSLKYISLDNLLKYFEEFSISDIKDLEEDFETIYNMENEGYSKYLYNPILKKVASKNVTFDDFFEGQKKNKERFETLNKEHGRVYKLGEKENILDYVVVTEWSSTSKISDYVFDKTYLEIPPDTTFCIENIDNIKLIELNASLNYDAAYGVIFLNENGDEISQELTLGELQEKNKEIYDKNHNLQINDLASKNERSNILDKPNTSPNYPSTRKEKIELYDKNYFNIEKQKVWYKGTDIITPKIILSLLEFLDIFDFETLDIEFFYIYKGGNTYEINGNINKKIVINTFKENILNSKVKEICYFYGSTILEIYVE